MDILCLFSPLQVQLSYYFTVLNRVAGTRRGYLWNTCFGVLLTRVPPDVARTTLNIAIHFEKRRGLINLYLEHLNTTLITFSVGVVTTDGQTPLGAKRLRPQWFCGPERSTMYAVMSGYSLETDSWPIIETKMYTTRRENIAIEPDGLFWRPSGQHLPVH